MEYITNTITQIGKELSCDNDNGKIIVNKYDNKVSKLIFSFDEAITGRKYIALLNPVTKKYHIEPIINNEVVITTKISAYPGKWNLLLIATDDDYEIEDNNIDQSKVTYVSNSFGRIIVRDNFLDESEIEKVENPAIDEMLEALRIAQDRLENAAIVADENASSASADREHVDNVKQSIDNIFEELQNIQETVKDNFSSIEDINSKIESNKQQVEDLATDITQKASDIAEKYESINLIKNEVESKSESIASDISNFTNQYTSDFNSHKTVLTQAGNECLSSINELKNNSISEITSSKNESLQSIKNQNDESIKVLSSAKESAISEVNSAGSEMIKMIGKTFNDYPMKETINENDVIPLWDNEEQKVKKTSFADIKSFSTDDFVTDYESHKSQINSNKTNIESLQENLQNVQSSIPTKVGQLENDSKYLSADGSVSFGRKTVTTVGEKSIAFGYDVEASGQYSFAEGELTKATGRGSHAEGGAGTIASNKYAHGEGYGTTASGQAAHSEGYNTYATGSYSHASGYNSKATASMANAQNYGTQANGQCSHAEGFATVANQTATHAEGGGTIASCKYQHVQGKYNVEDADGKYAHIVGGGTDANNRKNIHTVDWDGNAEYAGDVTVHYGDNTIPIGAILKSLLDNPYMHRNIFRGKSLGESITEEQLAAIRDGSFDDLYVGDYWEINGVRYRIADINYWRNVGYPESVQKLHILIVPDTILGSGQMHTSNSTSGGYNSSTMKNARLNQIANSLPDAFKNILISHRMFSDGAWINASVDLMNEVMVHGTYICTDNNNRQTSDTQQLALFRLVPELKVIGTNYWLRNVSSSQTYALVSQYGDASNDAATSTYGIRPVFAIYGE